jgi:zinc D-Ala-D-Ala carboxypeptidase
MNLSTHFTLAELTRTSQSALADVNRAEALAYLPALRELAAMLEVVRMHFGKPLKVNSGFRGAVNAATPGASKTSQHTKGEAADIESPGVDDAELHRWIVMESGLRYGQCILERPPGRSWVHLSLGEPWRLASRSRQALTFDGVQYRTWSP